MTVGAATAAVVMAAGLGTRFRSDRAKVMHRIAGRTMLTHILEVLRPMGLAQIVVVVGHQAEDVRRDATATGLPGLTFAQQDEQRGTGHAVQVALEQLAPGVTHVLVVPGDVPLLLDRTLRPLVDSPDGAAAVLLTTQVDDATGYGRVIRDTDGGLERIVEQPDASPEQLAIREVNGGVYLFDRSALAAELERLDPLNAQGELYLTDVVGALRSAGQTVLAVAADPVEVSGVNDRVQLAAAADEVRRRTLDELMRSGVTIVDPATTYVDAGVEIGTDTTLLPGSMLEGSTRIGAGATIGPYTRLVDAEVEDGATVANSVVVGASVGPGATVGPYSYLRPGTRLERGSKVGAFVEIKNSAVGEDSKVPHLSYVGDADIGRDVNIGAGTVTVNYDGRDKHRTVVADGAFVGSDTMLVAPVRIGRGAMTGASSAITKDVPDGALAVERSEQVTLEGWADRRRARADEAEGGTAPTEPTDDD